MPILAEIGSALGGNIASGVADIIKLFKVDPNLALEKKVELDQIQAGLQAKALDLVQAQLQTNTAEAASKSVFVAGWRPYVGWILGTALGYGLVLQPFIVLGLVIFHSNFDATKLPTLNSTVILELLSTMLGFGALRSWDKNSGTDNGH